MADMNCPNCGMPNPDDQNICSFCRQPLHIPQDDSSIHPGDMPTKKTTAELEPILPDWLRDARAKARENAEEEQAESAAAKPAAEEPAATDWLAGLDAAGREDEKEELPEWMRGSAPPAPPASKPKKEKTEETFPRRQEVRWESEPFEEPAPQPEDGIPFWMKGEEEPAEDKKDFSNWLTQQDSPAPAAPAPAASPFDPGTFRPNTGELISWLDANRKPAETPAEPANAEPLPDWVANLGKEENVPPPGEPAASEPFSFDWLKEESSKPFAPFQPSQMPDEGAPADDFSANLDLPDWMKPAAAETPAAQPAESAPLDWLNQPAETPPAQPAPFDWLNAPAEPAAPQADSGLPDWMRSETEKPAAAEVESGLPDWMHSEAESPATPAPSAQPDEFSFDWLKPAAEETSAPAAPASDLPDWMKAQPETPAADELGAAAGLGLGWLASMPPAAQEPTPPASAPAFVGGDESLGEAEELFSADMPDWLSSIAPTEQTSDATASLPQLPPEISPAELPSWVQAMRPVETALPEAPSPSKALTVGPTENQGPLAGLQNVLPAAPDYAPSGRPKAYSLRLQPTQDQLDHAALLEQMIGAETQPKPFRAAASGLVSQRVLRWVITALLIALISVTFFFEPILPLPAQLPLEAARASDAIVGLADGAPVLMIFDYEPALAGEMEAAAASFVDRMIELHRPRIHVLSTSPTGSALAERFLSGSPTRLAYQPGQDYTNLGYLPGESAGMLSFAVNPHAALPSPAWNKPAAQGVTRFADYALVILLTDRAETARAWVEQTSSHRGAHPFVIVSSAQAAPLIRPYYESGQVNGLVSGLHDGAAFDQNTGLRQNASYYWNAYNLSILLVCALIVIGGLWNFALGARARRQGLEEG